MFQNDQIIFHFNGPMGVRVEIGQSLLMLVGLLVVFSMRTDPLVGLIFAAMLITAIFLHELGHAWGCRVQGIPVRRVMLHGGGGFCEQGRSLSRTEQELFVIMGPLVNLGLWAICGLLQHVLWNNAESALMQGIEPSQVSYKIYAYLGMFGFLNLALFIFNMIPVQPLDGGKLLHLFLLRFLGKVGAHRITGVIGLVLSVVWIPAAILFYVHYGWILFFIPSISAHYRMARGQLA